MDKKLHKFSLGSIVVLGGIAFGVIGSSAIANNTENKLNSNVILEEVPKIKTVFQQAPNQSIVPNDENSTDESIVKNPSYVNYSKEKITEVIKMYAILENCQFQNAQKDEFIYYLSEYVTSAVQAEKYTAKDLKDQYINFSQSYQPPHPTQEDCIEIYHDAKETVNYWNEKKNSAFNELFSSAKNRYSPDPEENIDIVQELIEIPYSSDVSTGLSPNLSTDNAYSLASHAKKLPWNIKTSEIFNMKNSTPEGKSHKNVKDVEKEPISAIIPDKKQNINKIAIVDEKPFEDNTNVHIEPSINSHKIEKK